MPPNTFAQLVEIFVDIFHQSILVLGALALFLFLWGVAMVIFQGGNEQAVRDGKQRVLWGIIALFVMLSLWGLVELLNVTFFQP